MVGKKGTDLMNRSSVSDAINTLVEELSGGHPEFIKMTLDELLLHNAKNKDYAQGGNPLGNFDRVGSILALYPGLNPGDPTVVSLIYMFKQLDAALWMLSQGYEGDVENIDTRLRDVHVYAKLARIIHKEDSIAQSRCS